MKKYVIIILLLLLAILNNGRAGTIFGNYENDDSEIFLAKITTIDENDARRVGRLNGFEVERKLLSFDDVYIGKKLTKSRRRRQKRGLEDEIVEELLLSQQVLWIEKLHGFRRYKRESIEPQPFGKVTTHVWNLQPSMRIKEAWASGYNATEVTIAIVDDGVDVSHIDLRKSFSASVSFDFVQFGSFPTPNLKNKDSQHGTQCAGLVTMEGNRCGLGVGHGAKLGGIRLLGEQMLNDALEGDALAFQKNQIDIYSVSWGPQDDGKTADKPGKFTENAIRQGIRTGRNGKGNIFVWASGNGGSKGDNCALDGYVNNEYTLSFGVVSSDGSPAQYAEGCSAVLAAVSGGDSMIQTTGFDSSCSSISGSSASAAIASGIIALAIQAKPSLTQRDIQQIIIHSTNTDDIKNVKWTTNGAGFKFNPKVGFGLLDAQKIVEIAETWRHVEPEKSCEIAEPQTYFSSEDYQILIKIPFVRQKCDKEIKKIEKVTISLDLLHDRRGAVRMELLSPQGTISELLAPRPSDFSKDLIDWKFVSSHFFNENPEGIWKLHISSEHPSPYRIENLTLRITGT